MMGFEPTTPGTTIQCSNQLSYNHHLYFCGCKDSIIFFNCTIATPAFSEKFVLFLSLSLVQGIRAHSPSKHGNS